MAVSIDSIGEVIIARLSGEIDHHSAREIREKIDEALDCNTPSLLMLDFEGVTFMDSSGIGLVMGRYKKVSETNAEIHLTNLSPYVYKVMRLAGMEKLAKLSKKGENNEGIK